MHTELHTRFVFSTWGRLYSLLCGLPPLPLIIFRSSLHINPPYNSRVFLNIDRDSNHHRYYVVQYYFKNGVEHVVEPAPHGNSKSREKSHYVRTWQSTKDTIVEGNNSAKLPRECIGDVIDDVTEDSQSCAGLGQLPRGRQQVKDFKRNDHNSSQGNFSSKSNDPWYSLIQECKAQARSKNTASIHDIRVGAEPFCVLANERQLNDFHRFCCNVKLFKPLTVDPTFDIGEFNVTPISYQNLLLEMR